MNVWRVTIKWHLLPWQGPSFLSGTRPTRLVTGTTQHSLVLTLFSLGGVIVTPPDLKSKFSVGNSASNTHKTTWLFAFLPNESDGTKFGPCFFIGLDLRDRFARSLLGENGYFIVFWHFRPNFKLILHTSKWILCHQKFLELFIYILGSLQHNFYGHWDCLSWKLIGGVTFTPPQASSIIF